VVALLGLVLYVPPLRDLFGFSALSLVDVVIALAAGLVSVFSFEVFKIIRRRPTHARAEA
jgi:Ca2+-transporting ATPase